MKILGKVRNGNYDMFLFDNGTKIRKNDLDCLIPEKPESMDLKITNMCDKGCPFCHEDSKPDGKHGDIMNLKFIDTLLPYTELAIGGGDPLSHPDLIPFLKKCKERNLICNMTVNQVHFMKQQKLIKYLVDNKLIWGLGLSLVKVTDNLLELIKQYPNLVIHLINGIHEQEEITKLFDKNLKVLILGYKEFRRGKDYYSDSVASDKFKMKAFLPEMIKHFKVVSFDNLALKQLDVKSLMSEDKWNEFYMGSDGTHTMYVDAINKTFSTSSTTPICERKSLLDDIKPMFDYVRSLNLN